LISIAGTAVSFILTAFAPNAAILFLARALDGLTAGNIPIVMAIISDTTKPEERAKAFGLVGAAFSFGFVFGPGISAATAGFGLGIPFLIAAGITVIAVIIAALYLPETNAFIGKVTQDKLFDFPKLWHTLFDPRVGATFFINLLLNLAFACSIVYGYQAFAIKVLHISASQNAILFTMFGVVGFLTQSLLIERVTKRFGVKRAFTLSIAGTALSLLLMFVSVNLAIFVVASIILGIVNGIAQTMLPAILSSEAKADEQGAIMGLSASYQSIGQIIGPVLGGAVATLAINWTFLAGAIIVGLCLALSLKAVPQSLDQELSPEAHS
jgi:MFS family permease